MYQFRDIVAGSGGGSAALAFQSVPVRSAASFGRRTPDLRSSQRDFDLVVDLGVRIGSREWFRGLATCTALCAGAWWLAPAIGAVPGPTPAPLPDAQWEESRALSFAPLALGADTGRRMAPTEAVGELREAPERPRVELSATLGQGDGFERLLERSGLSGDEAQQVAAMVADVVPLADIPAGTNVSMTLGRRPNRSVARPLESLSFRARFDLALAVNRTPAGLALAQTPIAIDETPLRIQGRVGDSLYRSARAAGAPARAVEAYIRALATQLNIGEVDGDDMFDIIIEHRRAATGETETGKLLFAGLERPSGRGLRMLQWEVDGRAQWFEASGVGRRSGTLQQPVPGPVTSSFGLRMHPILGYARMHRGLDFRAAYGTPILAATDGRVAAAGWAGGYGRQVRLAHSGGLLTSYSHMSRISVAPGQAVRQGQVIGYVGSTGLSTGPHLHYELYRNGAPVNPASVRFITRSQLAGADLEGFRSRLRRLLALPVGAPARAAGAPDIRTAP